MATTAVKYVSPELIETLKDRIDLVDVVAKRISLKKTGKNYQSCCPFHEDKSPSFSVNPDKQTYTCFSGCAGSGGSGDIFEFVMRLDNLTFAEAATQLALEFNVQIPMNHGTKKTKNQLDRDATLLALGNTFIQNTVSQQLQFKKLCDSIRIAPAALGNSGFKLGFTSNLASIIKSEYLNKPPAVIREAQRVGLLNPLGDPYFSDNSIVVITDAGSTFGLLFIDEGANVQAHPWNPQNGYASLFGVNQLLNNAQKLDRQRRLLGDYLFVAESPLAALQLISNGISNVVSPSSESVVGTDDLPTQIQRLNKITSGSTPVFLFSSDSQNRFEFARLVTKIAVEVLESVITYFDPIDCVCEFLQTAVKLRSMAAARNTKSYYHQSFKVQTPLEFTSDVVTAEALSRSSMNDFPNIFDVNKSAYIQHVIDCAAGISICESQMKQLVLGSLGTFGLGSREATEFAYPGLQEVVAKRTSLANNILAASICNYRFAQTIAGQQPGFPNNSLPTLLTPNEKMLLALTSMETLDLVDKSPAAMLAHISGFPSYLYPGQESESAKLKDILKNALRESKERRLSLYDLGASCLEELTELSNSCQIDPAVVLHYNGEFLLKGHTVNNHDPDLYDSHTIAIGHTRNHP